MNTNLLSGRMNQSETKMVYQHEHRSRSTGPDMPLSRGPQPQQQIYFSMSSPTSSGEYPPAKRRRVSPHGYDPSVNANGVYSPSSTGNAPPAGASQQQPQPIPHAAGPIHSVNGQPVILQQVITKRGARACTACRKGKNRCEGDAPCRRCQLSGTQCVFEKPDKRNLQVANGSIERISRLEGQYLIMQSQMIGLQSSMEKILTHLQNPSQSYPLTPASLNAFVSSSAATAQHPGDSRSSHEAGFFSTAPPSTSVAGGPGSSAGVANVVEGSSGANNGGPSSHPGSDDKQRFPVTPGFVPTMSPSSSDESEDTTLPRATLKAPIVEALQGLANAAAEVAAINQPLSHLKKRKRIVEPTPTIPFPHVVEKGLVSDDEARSLYNIFFSGCHYFIPLFDPAYDTYEALKERTPFCLDAILAVAAKIRAGGGPPGDIFHSCLEDAEGIARSTLFGPVIKKEAVQAILLLAAWSTSGWLLSGHAVRMALDLGLHHALEKLAETNPAKKRNPEEERDLVVSARIWLCLYWFDHQMSLDTGRPLVLRDESSVRHCRVLLNRQYSSPSDLRLVAQVELIAQKTQIYETLSPPTGSITHATPSFIRRANVALDKWWADCDALHGQVMDESALLRRILISELYYAKLWLICVALRGTSWDKMPFEQRELAFQAKEAASNCLGVFLGSQEYQAALRYAVHDSLVTAAFSGLFLLKIANLFPEEVEVPSIISQVEQLAQLLSDVAAERYTLTLRLMLAHVRRKLGLGTSAPTTTTPGQGQNKDLSANSGGGKMEDLSVEDLGFNWPTDIAGNFSQSSIPLWLKDSSLGLPVNGNDGIFVNIIGDIGPPGNGPVAW